MCHLWFLSNLDHQTMNDIWWNQCLGFPASLSHQLPTTNKSHRRRKRNKIFSLCIKNHKPKLEREDAHNLNAANRMEWVKKQKERKTTFVMRSTTSKLKVCGRVSCPLAIFAKVSSSPSLQDPNGISAWSMKYTKTPNAHLNHKKTRNFTWSVKFSKPDNAAF